jgi:1-pyrroline-5-carboxylate dehydrogenase
MFTPFETEPYVDFSQDEPRAKYRAALDLVGSQLGREYPLMIGGEAVTTGEWIDSTNPANPSQIVGRVAMAGVTEAERAVQAAYDAFPEWSRVPPEVRARYLVKVAAILRRRIYEFSAWMTYEVSKNWLEAYADTAETIDFLEFYAREMVRVSAGHPTTPYPGEENEARYLPMGVVVAICPWNFPLAIMAGMTVSAVVTGNTVVTKPAETSSVIAAKFFEVLEEARLPAGVVNFLPGDGEVIGDTLTGHPLVRLVSFTGSKEVGLHINQRVATHQKGQKWIKRAILEMGGKDCIAVDDDADIDAAAEGIVAAAFGFQGQKCSACSRVAAHEAIYDELLEKVVLRARALTLGDPTQENHNMGAVIDDAAAKKIRSYIEIGKNEGRMVLGGDAAEGSGPGYFVGPHIFADVDRNSRLAQEEIFGPVLAFIKARDFEDLLDIANSTEYGLTGSLYSRKREHLERARHEFHVGNLYLNRKCTGALVDVQPFGGFNMSGTDSKAGGRDYLLHFLLAKSVSEQW